MSGVLVRELNPGAAEGPLDGRRALDDSWAWPEIGRGRCRCGRVDQSFNARCCALSCAPMSDRRKVLVLVGSPRKTGNSAALAEAAARGAQDAGADVALRFVDDFIQ